MNRLAVLGFEVLHEGNQGIDAFFREGVVDGSADAAYGAVTFQRLQVFLGRFLDELGFELFGGMMTGIAQDFVKYVMNVQVVQNQVPAVAGDAPAVQNMQTSSSDDVDLSLSETGGAAPSPQPAAGASKKQETVVKDAFEKTPRNAPCPCGSGKKFKNCHGETN